MKVRFSESAATNLRDILPFSDQDEFGCDDSGISPGEIQITFARWSAIYFKRWMEIAQRMDIRIHRPGQGRSTGHHLVTRLETVTPRSYRKAQDVLIAAKRYGAGPGFLRSRKSLIRNLQREIYALRNTLDEDSYDLESSSAERIFSYMSEVSDAHPNWQNEYAILNKFIPMCF